MDTFEDRILRDMAPFLQWTLNEATPACIGARASYASPIEYAMAQAFFMLTTTAYSGIATCFLADSDIDAEACGNHLERLDDGQTYGGMFRQVSIGAYRVDFLGLYTQVDGLAGIVIECDGHDFHEKTREQAVYDKARDRFLQLHDYHVLRFAGSEIWRSPILCAATVLRHMSAKAHKPWAEDKCDKPDSVENTTRGEAA